MMTGKIGRHLNERKRRAISMMRWILLLIWIAPISSFVTWRGHFSQSHRHYSPSLCMVGSIPDEIQTETLFDNEAWRTRLDLASKPYIGSLFATEPDWQPYLDSLGNKDAGEDPLWEQVKLEAMDALGPEPEAGPQLYQGILSQPNLLEAIVTTIANEIETELIPATALKNLFLTMLTLEDEIAIHLDIMAVATRSANTALIATMFHKGLHAVVCYRVGHRLWLEERTGLAYYMQSTVSRKYSADIHPASRIGSGIYLNAGGGIVIGETAVVGQDVSILQGVTLGGTGTEEFSDRHPKVGNGVILADGSTVLGNIPVGDGAVVMPKSIVTKPVPPLARVSGIPARIMGYRELTKEEFEQDDLEYHLEIKYMEQWQAMKDGTDSI